VLCLSVRFTEMNRPKRDVIVGESPDHARLRSQ
jgi:hypothetical protein